MLKGIIFDMDGVIVNSEPMHYKAYCLTLKEYEITYPYEIYKNYIGSTNAKLIEDIRSRHTLPCTNDEFIKKLSEQKDFLIDKNGFEEIKGIRALVKTLHAAGYKLAVASSSPYEYIIRVTKAFEIYNYFDKIVSGANVPNPKPAPDVFLKTADELNLAPSECIVIEDSTNGVRAAKAAGMPCIGFYNPDSGDQILEEASVIVKSFENLSSEFVKQIHKEYAHN